ncbi:expansin EXLX1 family cellulose-binding protein [Hyalangium versicolor]|uniref:expansin EXLX1 family cellulose-binding protein n=1 Tax=Hyalangium versicolor TaxID=2861190 RepID=UPI001CCFF281|nr:expansin EXLX1 family cellulose-binding protein [Hyalangium versicolor]
MRASLPFSLRNLGIAACLLTLAACSDSSTSPGELEGDILPLSDFRAGIATWYDATGAGNCGYDASPNDMDVAAMDKPEFDNSAMCGACAEVQGPQGTVRVRIVDSCPECPAGHLDLSEQAFSKIAPVKDGRVTTQWRLISCNVQGPVRYRIKEGSSEWWVGIQVRNHRLPIKKLEYQKSGSWVEIKREDYNYFVANSGIGPGPVKIRITATDGQQLVDTLPEIKAEKIFDGAAQFSLQ